MTCDTFLQLLPRYPDDMPSEEVTAQFLRHAAECPACAALLSEHEEMLAELALIDEDLEVPDAFATGWRTAIREDAAKAKAPWYARWQSWAVAAAALVVVIGGTALMRGGYLFAGDLAPTTAQQTKNEENVVYGAMPMEAMTSSGAGDAMSLKRSADVYEEAEVDMDNGGFADDALTGGGAAQEAIVLRTASLTLSSKAYDADMAQILSLLEGESGWVEYQSVSGEPLSENPDAGRYAYLKVRVPSDSLEAFVGAVSGLGSLTYSEVGEEDVSQSFYDTQGRLDTYIAQRDRLNELMAQAEDMADIIALEARLSEVQWSIESMSSRLGDWTQRAQNATVTIRLTEVEAYREDPAVPLGQRIGDTFSASLISLRAFLADILVFLALAAPYLVAIAVVGIIAFAIYQVRKRRKDKT